jgi:hypothetical protein
MRTTTILRIVCLTGALAFVQSAAAQTERTKPAGTGAGPAQAQPGSMAPTQKPTSTTRPVKASGGSLAPLTTNECLGLGGDVLTGAAKECTTGKACQTTTISAAGVQHVNVQCITVAE